MGLPIKLYPGYVSIYGAGSLNGLVPPTGYGFGTVDQLVTGGDGTIILGQSVMFPNDTRSSIFFEYNNSPYFLLPQEKIIFVEESPL